MNEDFSRTLENQMDVFNSPDGDQVSLLEHQHHCCVKGVGSNGLAFSSTRYVLEHLRPHCSLCPARVLLAEESRELVLMPVRALDALKRYVNDVVIRGTRNTLVPRVGVRQRRQPLLTHAPVRSAAVGYLPLLFAAPTV